MLRTFLLTLFLLFQLLLATSYGQDVLSVQGKNVTDWAELSTHKDPRTRLKALAALSLFAETDDFFIRALKDESPQLRKLALISLATRAGHSKACKKQIQSLIHGKDTNEIALVLACLAKNGEGLSVKTLEELRSSNNRQVRWLAAVALVNRGRMPSRAAVWLKEVLTSRDLTSLGICLTTIKNAEVKLKRKLEECLLKLFQRQDEALKTQQRSILSLGILDSELLANKAILDELMNCSGGASNETVCRALSMNGVRDPSYFIKQLKNPKQEIRFRAAKILARVEQKQAKDVVLALLKVLDAKDEVQSKAIFQSLRLLGFSNQEVLKGLDKYSQAASAKLRAEAQRTLYSLAMNSEAGVIKILESKRGLKEAPKESALRASQRLPKASPALQRAILNVYLRGPRRLHVLACNALLNLRLKLSLTPEFKRLLKNSGYRADKTAFKLTRLLKNLDPLEDNLVQALNDCNRSDIRGYAAEGLKRTQGRSEKVMRALNEALADGYRRVVWNSAIALLKRDLNHKEALETLAQELCLDEEQCFKGRSELAYLLSLEDFKIQDTTAELIAVLAAEKTSSYEKLKALFKFGMIQPRDAYVTKWVAKSLNSKSEDIRSMASWALYRMREDGLPGLFKGLKNSNETTRYWSVQSLSWHAKLKWRAKKQQLDLSPLVPLLKDRSARIRLLVVETLSLWPKRCWIQFAELVFDKDHRVRAAAASSMFTCRKEQGRSIALLAYLLRDSHDEVSSTAEGLLAALWSETKGNPICLLLIAESSADPWLPMLDLFDRLDRMSR